MAERDSDGVIGVNCGRCGKSLVVRLEDIMEKRTIDCQDCETKVRNGKVLPGAYSAGVRVPVHADEGIGIASSGAVGQSYVPAKKKASRPPSRPKARRRHPQRPTRSS
jgi:hypothetical protein